MMYEELNESVREKIDQLIDPETGEFTASEDELLAQINSFQVDRQIVLEYLARGILKSRAEAVALKAEEEKLKNRRENLFCKQERLLNILRRECPETTVLGPATLCYRKGDRLEITDEEALLAWLKENNLEGFYREPTPIIYKSEIRKLIDSGMEVPGCRVVEERKCSLKRGRKEGDESGRKAAGAKAGTPAKTPAMPEPETLKEAVARMQTEAIAGSAHMNQNTEQKEE